MGLQNYGHVMGNDTSTSATSGGAGKIADIRLVGAYRPQIGGAKGGLMVPGAHHRGAHSLGQGINSSTAHIAGHAITRSPLSP